MTERWRDFGALALGLSATWMLASCSGADAFSRPRATVEAGTRTDTQATATPSASNRPSDAETFRVEGEPAKEDAKAEVVANRPDPATFACGSTRCSTASEVCCGNSDPPMCAARSHTSDNLRDPAKRYESYEADCDRVGKRGRPYLRFMARCDESQDCGAHEACCRVSTGTYTELRDCRPLGPGGESPCPGDEYCVPGGPACRTPGSECMAPPWQAREAFCRKRPTTLACGAATCSGATPACCGEPPTCRTEAECSLENRRAGEPNYECARHEDCLDGQWCIHSRDPRGSLCLASFPFQYCESAADCSAFCSGSAARCAPHADSLGMNACICLKSAPAGRGAGRPGQKLHKGPAL